MRKLKNSINGITLVTLVITIIILLILAGITISSLTNTGIFVRTKEAKNLTQEKTEEENEILTNYLEQINTIIEDQIQETVPDGATVIPINDVIIWLKTGGLSKRYSYTTIEEVIADNTCTESLMNNENAMKYLARSTGFANAICSSETAMTYLGSSLYLNNTILNSDFWKQKIKASPYWDKVYASKSITIYGAANETITIDGYGGSFITDSYGTCTHALPLGEITLNGSISKQSFSRTIMDDTVNIYVMPEHSLYWYGNECINVTGGWTGYNWNTNSNFEKQNMSLYMHSYRAGFITNKPILFNGETLKCHIINSIGVNNGEKSLIICNDNTINLGYPSIKQKISTPNYTNNENDITLSISSLSVNKYVSILITDALSNGYMTVDKIWSE